MFSTCVKMFLNNLQDLKGNNVILVDFELLMCIFFNSKKNSFFSFWHSKKYFSDFSEFVRFFLADFKNECEISH